MASRFRPMASAAASSILLLAWMHIFFLAPLKDEAFVMHERQLDPTEIIAIPYDLPRLFLYVSVTVFAATVIPVDSRWKQLPDLALVTILCFAAMILCGASPFENLMHTLLAALYLTTLACFDPPIFQQQQQQEQQQQNRNATTTSLLRDQQPLRTQLLQRMRGVTTTTATTTSRQDKVAVATTQATISLTIPLQILLLYDRGWQVQRWPVPVILGSTYGWAIGSLLGTFWAISFPSSARDD